jgi:hypothetical protein
METIYKELQKLENEEEKKIKSKYGEESADYKRLRMKEDWK